MANEKRLIDAYALWAEFMDYADTGIEFDGEGVANAIANAPTVDAVEVVRCKDCLWFDQKDKLADVFRQERHCYCTDMNTYMPESGFCSSGERREGK